jgi:hypothetical protein
MMVQTGLLIISVLMFGSSSDGATFNREDGGI